MGSVVSWELRVSGLVLGLAQCVKDLALLHLWFSLWLHLRSDPRPGGTPYALGWPKMGEKKKSAQEMWFSCPISRSYFRPEINLWGWRYYPHFTDGETKAEKMVGVSLWATPPVNANRKWVSNPDFPVCAIMLLCFIGSLFMRIYSSWAIQQKQADTLEDVWN